MHLSTLLLTTAAATLVSAGPCATIGRPSGDPQANVEADGGEFTLKNVVRTIDSMPGVEVHYRAAPYSNYVDFDFFEILGRPDVRNLTAFSFQEERVIACYNLAEPDLCFWLNARDWCFIEVTNGVPAVREDVSLFYA